MTDLDRLLTRVRDDFGIDLVSATRVEHGADDAASLWRASDATGMPYAVKLTGGGDPAGQAVAAYLADNGVPGIAAPRRTRAGDLWSDLDGRRLSVVPWVSDRRAIGGHITDRQWGSLGMLLARVHAAPVTGPVAALPRETHTHERAGTDTRELQELLRGGSHATDELAAAFLDLWRTAATDIQDLLTYADRLGAVLRTRRAPFVVCHADPHLGNVLLGDGDSVWLIDWDDAILAPPERDLMFAIGGVLAFEPVSQTQEESFFDGYGPVQLDPTRLAYYRCVRALEDLTGFALQLMRPGSEQIEDRAFALEIVEGILSPTGFVRLAKEAIAGL